MAREYVLAIGSEDRLRLDILNEIYGFQSRDFVTNVVLKKFSPRSVIEIGCGHGQILCFWGKQLESSGGKITGIDLFEDQVALALERE